MVVKNLTNNKPSIRLIDLRNNPKFETKAKKLVNLKEVQNLTIARAVLTSSNVKKVSLNFFIKLNSGNTPIKFFTNEDEALNWLRSFKK